MNLNFIQSAVGLMLIYCITISVQLISPSLYRSDVCVLDEAFLVLLGVTPTECAYECFVRSRCAFISYHRLTIACFLHDDTVSNSHSLDNVIGCFSLNVTYITEIELGHVSNCAERLCPKDTRCLPNTTDDSSYDCIASDCGEPSEFDNADKRSRMVRSETNTSYACQQGYTVFGIPEAVCTKNGNWSYKDFTCYCNCPVPVLQNGAIIDISTGRLTVNSTVTFQCNVGYYNITPLVIKCDSDGEWLGIADIKCLKHCSEPPIVANAVYSDDQPPYTIMSTISYTCQNGYYLAASSINSVNCLQNGAWSTPTPQCYKHCGGPPSVAHADRIQTPVPPYTVQSSARYQCDWGYSYNRDHEGIETIRCNYQGAWTPEMHCCLGFSSWWDYSKGKCCAKVCIVACFITCN